ncbi:hypothetical protein HanPI659440_Chr03g0133371 [Helianthus annuus]|nr:hypothetical protein HanPI659440_Chr03g0133371 [Helianthus annuus]
MLFSLPPPTTHLPRHPPDTLSAAIRLKKKIVINVVAAATHFTNFLAGRQEMYLQSTFI